MLIEEIKSTGSVCWRKWVAPYLLSLLLILLYLNFLQWEGGTVLYYKVILLKAESATFLGSLAMILIIILEKGIY